MRSSNMTVVRCNATHEVNGMSVEGHKQTALTSYSPSASSSHGSADERRKEIRLGALWNTMSCSVCLSSSAFRLVPHVDAGLDLSLVCLHDEPVVGDFIQEEKDVRKEIHDKLPRWAV
eukprot:UN5126